MKKQIVIVGILLGMMLVAWSGCTEQNSSDNTSSGNETNNQNNSSSTESIQTILAKAETIQSMYYEITVTTEMSGVESQLTVIKIWQKPPYLKEEITSTTAGITTNVSMIQRPEGTYVYNAQEGTYVLTTNTQDLQQSNSEMTQDLLNNQTITNLGTDTIDGKETTIIQYTPFQQGTLMTAKMWIWNERGVPLQAQFSMTMQNATITMNYLYNNYSFSEIPDSTFSVT